MGSTMTPKTDTRDVRRRLDALEATVRRLADEVIALNAALSTALSTPRPEPPRPELPTLLNLPDHLRKTIVAIIELGEGTADDVADRTGRVRNLESSYLNQLVRLGHLQKRREERHYVFHSAYTTR
jgi:hypothetical protein